MQHHGAVAIILERAGPKTYNVTIISGEVLTNYQVEIPLTNGNFDFSRSNGKDIRFYDGATELSHFIEFFNAVAKTAVIWVKVPSIPNGTKVIRMITGVALPFDASDPHQVFDDFVNLADLTNGAAPTDWLVTTAGGLVLDADNNATVSNAQGLPGRSWVQAESVIATGLISAAMAASRVPHQRNCFYAQGRWWAFWSDYTGSAPYALNFSSSSDGLTWEAAISVGITNPAAADAMWDVYYDPDTGYVHVICITQTGVIFQDGLQYRRGIPNADGTITWSAAWQTVISTGNSAGDPTLLVSSTGYVYITYNNRVETGFGDAMIIKNSAVDGTWATAAGFPVSLPFEAGDMTPVPARLAGGGVYVVISHFGANKKSVGHYSATGSATFAADGEVALNNVRGYGIIVPGLEIVGSPDGIVHQVYQSADAAQIIYRQRSAAGFWGTEIIISTLVETDISSPRLSLNRNIPYITWVANGVTYLSRFAGNTWTTPQALFKEIVETQLQHIMPAKEIINNILPMTSLADMNTPSYNTLGFPLRFRLIDITHSQAKAQGLRFRKNAVVAGQTLSADRIIADVFIPGYLFEISFYVVSLSANNDGDGNDGVALSIIGKNSGLIGPEPVFYGDGPQIGYFTPGVHHKIQAFTLNASHKLGIRIKAGSVYDLYLDDTIYAADIAFVAAPADLRRVRISSYGKHTFDIHFGPIQTRQWADTPPTVVVS